MTVASVESIAGKIRALVVDDEPLAREGIKSLLEEESDIQVVGESTNGLEAVGDIADKRPDLVFLDVQMPALDAFGVIRKVGAKNMPVTIFVTAHDEHALKAFQVHAVDYLLKPVKAAALRTALSRARAILRHGYAVRIDKQLTELLKALANAPAFPERFAVKSLGKSVILPARDIEWCESQDDYVALHAAGKKFLLHQTLGSMESQLDPDSFLRIHRSYIVRIESIRELRPLRNGDYAVLLRSGVELPLSRTHRVRAFALLGLPN